MSNENDHIICAPDLAWPGSQKAAVSLTYDDALPVHLEVASQLEALGLRATFYAPIHGCDLIEHPGRWKDLASKGHELGNHSVFHPCRRKKEMEHWLTSCFDLRTYSADRWQRELEVANLTLGLLDGRSERTYGNNCCNTTIGEGENEMSMDPILDGRVLAARGPHNNQARDPRKPFNRFQIGHFCGDLRSADESIQDIAKALDCGGWTIIMIHGVGEGTHPLYIAEDEHRKLVNWLADASDQVWTAPAIDVFKHILKSANENR